MNTDAKFDKHKALQVLRDHNVITCVLDYSGGNDEGGVDAVKVTYADGREENNPLWCTRTYSPMQHNPETNKWERAPLPEDKERANECADLIEQPVYDRYYSFAGDFYVSGTVTYDVPAGTVNINGDEQVYEPFEESL